MVQMITITISTSLVSRKSISPRRGGEEQLLEKEMSQRSCSYQIFIVERYGTSSMYVAYYTYPDTLARNWQPYPYPLYRISAHQNQNRNVNPPSCFPKTFGRSKGSFPERITNECFKFKAPPVFEIPFSLVGMLFWYPMEYAAIASRISLHS